MSDTVTLSLQGTVSLPEFSAALAHFDALITALSAESDASTVVWQIEALEYSSATTTARAVPTNGTQPDQIDRVVRAFLEVGQALEEGHTVPFSNAVRKEAQALAGVLKGSAIDAIRFETAENDAIIREAPATPETPSTAQSASYGAVTGRVQTLMSRSELRFALYDHIHDRAVSCYLAEGGESMMREVWGRIATVEGWVTRDPKTGRPLTVRRVTNVTPLPEVEIDAYKAARGAVPRNDDDPLPEVLTREIRDG